MEVDTTIIWKKVSDLNPDPNNPRKAYDKEKLKDMVEAAKIHGIVNAVEIDQDNIIVTGELRWGLAKLAGLKEIPCKVLKNLTPEQRLERQLIENLNRQDLAVKDCAAAIEKLFNHYKSFVKREGERGPKPVQKLLSKRLGISQVWLSQILKFEKEAPENVKELVVKGEIPLSPVLEVLKLPEEQQKKAFEHLKKRKIKKISKSEKFIDDVNEWVESGRKILDLEKIGLLNQEFSRILKSGFDAHIIPFYQLLSTNVKGDRDAVGGKV